MITSVDMHRLAADVKSAETLALDRIIPELQAHVRKEAQKGFADTEFEVPVLYNGVPAFDYKQVCAMVLAHFQKGGFQIVQRELGLFWITWKQPASEPRDEDPEVKVVYSNKKIKSAKKNKGK